MQNNNWQPRADSQNTLEQSPELGLRSETLTVAYESLETQLEKAIERLTELNTKPSSLSLIHI